MHKDEILCLAVLPEDLSDGRRYAQPSIDFTFDRMAYGSHDDAALRKRLANVIQGKSCEATLARFLRSHGIAHTTREGQTPHTDPDRFDLRILNQIVDVKTFSVPTSVAVPERLLNCLVLVPDHHEHDQWRHRRRYARFVFGFLNDRFSVHWREEKDAQKSQHPVILDEDIKYESRPLRLFITAAPTIAECERKFYRVRKGTRCPQYPGGTRIDNMGCRVAGLTSFREFINL